MIIAERMIPHTPPLGFPPLYARFGLVDGEGRLRAVFRCRRCATWILSIYLLQDANASIETPDAVSLAIRARG